MASTRRQARIRAAGRAGGGGVHEVNAGDLGPREEALVAQRGCGLGECPASPAAQVRPGSAAAARDGCPEHAERGEPELVGVLDTLRSQLPHFHHFWARNMHALFGH